MIHPFLCKALRVLDLLTGIVHAKPVYKTETYLEIIYTKFASLSFTFTFYAVAERKLSSVWT